MNERVYVIATPENLALKLERAGLATRALAFCIDLLMMAALIQVGWLLLVPLTVLSARAATALAIIGVFLVQWWYGALSEWRFGQTLGKRLFGLRVVDARGLPLTFGAAAIRNLLRMVDLLPLLHLVGATSCLLDPSGRRLGDLAAQCVVVRDQGQRRRGRSLPESPAGVGRELASATSWRRLSRDERKLVRRLCDTRERLAIADRVQLCDALVEHFVKEYGFDVPPHSSSERILLTLNQVLLANGTDQES